MASEKIGDGDHFAKPFRITTLGTWRPRDAGHKLSSRMTRAEQQRLYDLAANPPAGSKVESAKRFGIDLTLNLRLLRLAPTERDQKMEAAVQFVGELRRAASRSKT